MKQITRSKYEAQVGHWVPSSSPRHLPWYIYARLALAKLRLKLTAHSSMATAPRLESREMWRWEEYGFHQIEGPALIGGEVHDLLELD